MWLTAPSPYTPRSSRSRVAQNSSARAIRSGVHAVSVMISACKRSISALSCHCRMRSTTNAHTRPPPAGCPMRPARERCRFESRAVWCSLPFPEIHKTRLRSLSSERMGNGDSPQICHPKVEHILTSGKEYSENRSDSKNILQFEGLHPIIIL